MTAATEATRTSDAAAAGATTASRTITDTGTATACTIATFTIASVSSVTTLAAGRTTRTARRVGVRNCLAAYAVSTEIRRACGEENEEKARNNKKGRAELV